MNTTHSGYQRRWTGPKTPARGTQSRNVDKVAYVLKGFPRLSETFISNEVRLLTGLGMKLSLFSIKQGDALVDADGLPEVDYLPGVTSMSNTLLIPWLFTNIAPFAPAQLYWLIKAPLRYLRTLRFAIDCARRYGTGAVKKTFIKEFLFATQIARAIHKAGDFAHIHAHFCHDATNVAWMCSQLTGLPFSFTAHAKDIYQNKLNPGDLLERKLEATSFATTCTFANVHYLSRKTREPNKIHGIYHGLNIRLFRPAAPATTRSGPLKLLSIGRHVEKKGFDYLIDACALIKQRELDFTLTILGESGDQTNLLHKKIRELGLCDQVHLLGPIPQKDLPQIYRESDLFVLPCVIVDDGDRDGIPNVMAEAMACALPVVVSDISGIPELVVHEDSGLLLPQRDSGAIADAIVRLAQDPDLRLRLGRNARLSVEQDFDADTTHTHLYELFQQTLAEHREAARV